MRHFFDIAFTPAVVERQRERGSSSTYDVGDGAWPTPTALGSDERDFLSERDSFYLSTVSEDGWPYVQHRGGPAGFVKVLGPAQIGWVERVGNRQFITAGHLATDARVAMIAVDYTNRRRLKLYGHATYLTDPTPEQVAAIGHSEGRVEAIVLVDVLATDWNCPKHITVRYTADEVRAVTQHLTDRIASLEKQLSTVTTAPAFEQPA